MIGLLPQGVVESGHMGTKFFFSVFLMDQLLCPSGRWTFSSRPLGGRGSLLNPFLQGLLAAFQRVTALLTHN